MMDWAVSNATVKFAIINADVVGNNTIVAAVASKKIRVLQFGLVASTAGTSRWESGADGTALTGLMILPLGGSVTTPFSEVGLFETAAGVLLNLELSVALATADGWVVYQEV